MKEFIRNWTVMSIQFCLRIDLFWFFLTKIFARPPVRLAEWRKDIMDSRTTESVNREMASRTKATVVQGPFRGLRYPGINSYGSALAPKLLGSYECELNEAMEAAIARVPPLVIDVGCGEGYYAVGLAMRLPQSRVLAFDISKKARRLCRKMAELNQVTQNLGIEVAFTPDSFQHYEFSKGALIVCDCEGYEEQLFTAQTVKKLGAVDLIIEMHDPSGNLTQSIAALFSSTHEVQVIRVVPTEQKIPQFKSSVFRETDSPRTVYHAIAEQRPFQMEWVVAAARSTTTS